MQAFVVFLVLVPAAVAADGQPRQAWRSDQGAAQDLLEPQRHAAIAARLRERRAMLAGGEVRPAAARSAAMDSGADLAWPLQPRPGFAAFDYHGVSNFVDHDPRFPGFVQDYTCGTRTYDLASGYNHGGTDYFLWPFPWLMMDRQDIRIVAAAPGVIVEKDDGHFDRDCALSTSSEFNAVFVAQDDGLTAWYLHMKSGSLTPLPVGARVATGDYLGSVGSSGSSTAPHLHFELNDADGNVVDPRHGECNTADDRWIVQQPYEAPRIDTLTTHSAEPAGVACGVVGTTPVQETPFYEDAFQPGDTVWAFASYSDQRNGEVSRFSVKRPDGSVFAQWDFDLASQNFPQPFYAGTAFDWPLTLPPDAPTGRWTLNAQFAGASVSHRFLVGTPIDLDQHGLTGVWSIPGVDGQGVALETVPDASGTDSALAFAGWFTYADDGSGTQRWYTLQGPTTAGSAAATLPIYRTEGGRFAAADPTLTAPVGTATLSFSDCGHGSLDYAFDDDSGGSGSLPLVRTLPAIDCSPGGDSNVAVGPFALSGAWSDLGASGQGVFIELNPLQGVVFGGWFTYARDAASGVDGQRWLTLQGAFDGETSTIEDLALYETQGGLFGQPDTPTTQQVGIASLDFTGCSAAELHYRFDAGEFSGSSGTLELAPLQAPVEGCDLP